MSNLLKIRHNRFFRHSCQFKLFVMRTIIMKHFPKMLLFLLTGISRVDNPLLSNSYSWFESRLYFKTFGMVR